MRKASLVQTAIWETDFATLSPPAMLVYLMLITQPTVMTTGMLAIAEKRWRRYSHGQLDDGLDELEQRRFVWVDHDQEELVIRSWVKHNVIGNSKMVKAACDQFRAITSQRLRRLLAAEYPDVFADQTTLTDTPSDTPSHRASDTPSGMAASDPTPDTPSDALSGSTWSEIRGTRPEDQAVNEKSSKADRSTTTPRTHAPGTNGADPVTATTEAMAERSSTTFQNIRGEPTAADIEHHRWQANLIIREDPVGRLLMAIGSSADAKTETTIQRLVKKHHLSQHELERAREATLATTTTNRAAYAVGTLKHLVEDRTPPPPTEGDVPL